MQKNLPPLTLVLGGAASGKSKFAEDLCDVPGKSKIYIATSQAFDAEMQTKIEAHKKQRGRGWQTFEAPCYVASVLANRSENEVVLLDCLTFWLTNHLLADPTPPEDLQTVLSGLSNCAAPVVVVSNELGQGIVPENALARRFRNEHGKMNQAVAAQANLVVQVIAGLPMVLKGQLPGGIQ
ncbi:MAG: bifunctional adenosylcobinamide kinase/adenosylcobinamide-phosphate guanylyltransferase [Pseudomonadota bacterium]